MKNNTGGRFYTTFTGFCFYGIPFVVEAIVIGPFLAVGYIGRRIARAWRRPTML